ncbi:immunoglobulin-like domain-containing protein [Cytobacillus sp. FJAT-54145]|uniref:Immunoglobulin-like domain-containing protein n=1 Tax=Cytobacillus spartinae TaxID=3299023 RepID=A0ABW6KFK8_9BACI
MERYFRLLLCIAMSLIILSGCGSSSNSSKGADWEPTLHETVNNLNGVMINVKQGTVSSTGLTVIFENNSDKQCIYGEYYLLEKKIEGRWYQVPIVLDGNYGFNDIGYGLDPSDVREWTVDWDWLYGSLDTGEYRIVKDILDFRKSGDYDKYYLTAEFTIG